MEKIKMPTKYKRKQSVDSPNKILCDYCQKKVPENKIRKQTCDVNICLDCRNLKRIWIAKQKEKLPERRQFRYPLRPYIIRINLNKIDREELNNLYKILGYDPNKDIHQQFLERHNL
jgi:hypothetical protein